MTPNRRESDKVLIRLDANVETILAEVTMIRGCYDALVKRVGDDEGRIGVLDANLTTAGKEIVRLRDSQSIWSIINSIAAAIGVFLGMRT
jgi:hypothetical protein